jgi:RNA polymerase sigma-70 factor, ECF subfamily
LPEMSKIREDKKAPTADADLAYVVLCQKGDTEAFAMLVERHSKKMLNIAYRILNDYDEACDITQESFLSAFRSIGTFKAEAMFSTWLYRIVVNYARNRLKQRRSLSCHESASLDEKKEGPGGCATCLAAENGDNPEQLMECRERDAAVQKCIAALEGDYREVVVMRDIQGFSYEEIRDILRIPEGTVKSRLSRARLALKDCLKKVIGEL